MPLGFSRFVEYLSGVPISNGQLPSYFPNIEERTHIKERYAPPQCVGNYAPRAALKKMSPAERHVLDMSVDVVRRFFQTTNIKPWDCDALVLATSCVPNDDHQVDRLGTLIAAATGIQGRVIGTNAACSGFCDATAIAASHFEEERGDGHVVIVTTEPLPDLVDYDDEPTAILFGSAAAATSLVEDGQHELVHAHAAEVDDHQQLIRLDHRSARGIDGLPATRDCIRMNGLPLYKEGPVRMMRLVEDLVSDGRIQLQELILICHHQANGKFSEKIKKLVRHNEGWQHVVVADRIARRGNVGAASIPCALAELEEEESLPPGQVVACPAVGAGRNIRAGKLTEGIVAFRVGRRTGKKKVY